MFFIKQLRELKIGLQRRFENICLQRTSWVETRQGRGLADPLSILPALLVSQVNF
jgi:hypothetical protein